MAKGPRGENRPADVIGCAVHVAKIATGEIDDDIRQPGGRHKSGLAGAKARAERLTGEQRSEIARRGAAARWDGKKEGRSMMTECDRLSARFKAMESEGLVDVKFLLRNADEATTEEVCLEASGMLTAFEEGNFVPLSFKDSQRKV